MSDFDSPWKEGLDYFFQAFLEFFFADLHQGIDWNRGYEILDKELEQIVREGDVGKRLADKLFKVWRTNGEELCILIHVEVQSQHDPEFAERMHMYHYRIYDRFRRPVVSLAVLGDTSRSWRPNQFRYELFGCKMELVFPVVKLVDYGRDPVALETSPNPFGLIVLTHLQSQATQGQPEERCQWKIRLAKALLDRGIDPEEVRLLFKFIDWMMELPDELAAQFETEIYRYEQEKKMPYITTIEQRGIEKGRQEGREEGRQEEALENLTMGLEERFGEAGKQLLPALKEISDLDQLRAILKTLWKAQSLEEVKQMLPNSSNS